MKNTEYWEKFEASGQIEDYMQFKYGAAVSCIAVPEENTDANHNDGACSARDKDGRE
ncbi:MAG: hypothetical protein RSG59_00495 [Ruthenibacterium sp.]